MLPLLQRQFVEKRQFVSNEEILDYFAIGQCTPGIIAVNTATFIGYKRQKVLGAILSTLGVILPSVIIITAVAAFFSNFNELEIVQHAFAGIRIAVAAIIAYAVYKLIVSAKKNWFYFLVLTLSLILGLFFDLSPILIVLLSSILGLTFQRRKV